MTSVRAAIPVGSARAAFDRAHSAQQRGRVVDAMAGYREVLALDPDFAPAHFNLGVLLHERDDVVGAGQCFERAARLRPSAPDVWLYLGVCRESTGDLDGAIAAYQEAARLAPTSATPRFNAANAEKKRGSMVAALADYREAARLAPGTPEILLNLGNTLRETGGLPEAVDVLRQAAHLRPNWVEASWNLALALLALGRLDEGWAAYEARWAHLRLPRERGLPWPTWHGERLGGKDLLVWPEQGIGDEILFATCIPDLVDAGARVTLACDPRLVGLFERAFPRVVVVPDREWGNEPYDYQIPIGSVPRFVRQSRAAFPSRWSVLLPDRARVTQWQERLAALGPAPRIGICWRSGLRTADRTRAYSALADWAPLFELPGITWVNLQYDDCESELIAAEAATGVRIHRWPGLDQKHDIESTAALIWHLDLVITAPTAVSSLAGGLGTETWQLVSGTDWTTLGQGRSPWLPAVQVMAKDPTEAGWGPLFQRLRVELMDRAFGGGHRERFPESE